MKNLTLRIAFLKIISKVIYVYGKKEKLQLWSKQSSLQLNMVSLPLHLSLHDLRNNASLKINQHETFCNQIIIYTRFRMYTGKKSEHVELLKPRLELLCCSSNSFLKLVTDMLKVDSVKPKYLEFLLKHNDCEYHFKPSKAVSLFTTLIKKFSTNKNLVSLISQFQAYFEEDDILCEVYRKSQTDETVQNGLYQYFLKMYSSSPKLDLVAQSLNPVHRTKLLFHKVEKKKYEDADAVLKGGDIKPEEINLSGMIVALLDDLEDTQFLELLLKRGVAVKRSEEISPVTILLSRWKKSNSTQRKKIINNVVVLLKHGCEIKDLCSFYDGKQTTPVHVATELSILYGELH